MRKIALVSLVMPTVTIHPARQNHQNRLFEGMREYAHRHADSWFILSAQHHLVHPDMEVEPDEPTLAQMSRKARGEWAVTVLDQLHRHVQPGDHVLFLAGRSYREFLVHPLMTYGCTVEVPMAGLEPHEQLTFLRKSDT